MKISGRFCKGMAVWLQCRDGWMPALVEDIGRKRLTVYSIEDRKIVEGVHPDSTQPRNPALAGADKPRWPEPAETELVGA